MKKIFITILISIFAFGIFGFASQVLAADNGTEVLFENGNSAPLFNEANFLPGQTVTRWVKFKNNNTDPVKAAAKISSYSDSGGLGNWLDIVIKEGDNVLYNKTLADFFIAGEIMLSDVAGSEEKQYDFAITFNPDAGNTYQGKTLSFNIQVGVGSEDAIGGETGGSSSGGGGYSYQGLEIYNEANTIISDTSVTITWLTNNFSSSRVIYDTISHLDLLSSIPPNYGYAFFTDEFNTPPPGVVSHSVTITGLTSSTIYYYRVISHASPDTVGQELSFTTTGAIPTEQTGGATPGGKTGSSAVAGDETGGTGGGLAINVPANENLAEENALPEEELLGEVEGAQTLAVCPDCATIDWVLVLLFLILTILIYRQINIIFPEYLAEKNRGQLIKIILWSALLLAAALGAWLILYACHFKLIWPAVLIIGFYVLLLALNFGQKKKGLLAGIFGLVLAVVVAFTYYFCARLGWQSWLMIVALYLATLISYFIGLLAGKFWLVSPALALLITFLLVVLNRCAC